MSEPLSDPSDSTIEIRVLWQRTDYGSIRVRAAARGYREREKEKGVKQHADMVADEQFEKIRDYEQEVNPGWRLVESTVKVPAAAIEALFTDGAEVEGHAA